MYGTCKQQGIMKENGNKKDNFTSDQKERVDIYGTHNEEERRVEEFDTRNIYCSQEMQRKTSSRLHEELV